MAAIIVLGNPIEGFQFVGPFETVTHAAEFANLDGNIDQEWWTADLDNPHDYPAACTCDSGGSAGCPVHDEATAEEENEHATGEANALTGRDPAEG